MGRITTRSSVTACAALFSCAVLGLLALLGLAPQQADALSRKVLTTGNFTDNGFITVTPAQTEITVVPKKTSHVALIVTNTTGSTVALTLTTTSLEASADPTDFVQEATDAAYGAGSWITPERTSLSLRDGEQDTIDVAITPPSNAPVGSNYGGVEIDATGSRTRNGNSVAFKTGGLAQFFLNIPGAIKHDGRIASINSDHEFIFHGLAFEGLSAIYKNEGNTSDHVSGTITVTSIFGNKVASFPLSKRFVLRGGSREFRAVWTDIPWFGYFHPKITLHTDSGTKTESYPAILILPPWWLDAAIAAAVILPLVYRRWRKAQEWKLYIDEDFEDEEDGGIYG